VANSIIPISKKWRNQYRKITKFPFKKNSGKKIKNPQVAKLWPPKKIG